MSSQSNISGRLARARRTSALCCLCGGRLPDHIPRSPGVIEANARAAAARAQLDGFLDKHIDELPLDELDVLAAGGPPDFYGAPYDSLTLPEIDALVDYRGWPFPEWRERELNLDVAALPPELLRLRARRK